ncbi:hypothetical protein F0310_05020 (plasmid) [Borrelia sp. A-FGy1]|uniref:hypothetical protein n=1 Tax=Borrelia sp. A-FGy1 TaxID=2608247 RepID=UPI0015F5379B|nr:hypothetical protein [Borrelia sp. A-FGy1]QMU99779.1 hypothetical protein F0310_05020 [Borrelia sp. A-FGy1]
MRFILIIFSMLLLYVSNKSSVSAGVFESCNSYFCYKTYEERFNYGNSIRSVSFKKHFFNKEGKDKISDLEYNYKNNINKSYPSYHFEFKISGEKRMLNFKNVIFDGLEADMSIFDITEPSVQLGLIKDFHIGSVEHNKNLLGISFPIEVDNTFIVYLKGEFVDKLKQKDKIKIILIAHDDTEYVAEISNFLKKYDF